MVFSSLHFLFVFAPVFFVIYFLTPVRYRNFTLLVSSYLFYFWGAPKFVFVLVGTSIIDYLLSKAIAKHAENRRLTRLLVTISIAGNLGQLIYFKYANFFVDQINDLLKAVGSEPLVWAAVALPIGISFITFEKISYIVDVYRSTTKPAPSFLTYALFIAIFPHLIAGPIFRYHDVADQLLSRRHSIDMVLEGIFRFCFGIGKKVLIADPLGETADKIFKLHGESLSPGFAWLGIVCYAFQIYYDFSGYSDMAIGLGKTMGFNFVENFNHPYIAQSITEFWRRWHISLSNWMKEYLYIPLGGNRHGTVRTYFNLWLVFLFSGFWHGANWTFMFWGAYHGCFLILDRLFLLRVAAKLPRAVNIAVTFVIVMFGWVFFRADSIGQALIYCGAMFRVVGGLGESPVLLSDILSNRAAFFILVGAIFAFGPALLEGRKKEAASPPIPVLIMKFGSAIALFMLSVVSLTNSHFHPFIYFRF